jgi:cullin-associated NEDD8-dissociated protein 1
MSRGSNGAPNYNDLLKKTEHYDKDERYMAISDLCEALKRNAAHANSDNNNAAASSSTTQIDSQTERRICSAVLSLLDDSSNDVQTVAVKTLGVLLMTVQEEQVNEIADRLTGLVLDPSKSALRDVYAIGLKTLVETVPEAMGNVVSHRLIGRLIEGIHTNSNTSPSSSPSSGDDKNSEEIVLACLNVLTDLLTRFGSTSNSIKMQHEPLLNVTLSQLASPRPIVRKRAGTTIGVLATVISDTLLHRLVERLLDQIDLASGLGKSGKKRARNAHKNDGSKSLASSDLRSADTRSLIRTMCTVSGTVGHRLNQGHIDRIVPIFLRFCDPADADDEDYDSDEPMDTDEAVASMGEEAAAAMQIELRESCFAGFESFVLRCPALIRPHLDQIVYSALAYMRYDPNYTYDDDDDDAEDNEEEEEMEEEEEDEYSTEEDMSDEDDDNNWKVRRSAIRTLTAVVEATKHDPSKLWIDEFAWRQNSEKKTTVAGALVNRFKEREENCRVDIIECFTRLLSYTVSASSAGVLVLASSTSMDDDALAASGAVVVDLRSNVSSAIVKATEKQLSAKKGGERSKSSAIALLSTLCLAPGGIGSSEQITSVFRHVKTILNADDDANVRRHTAVNSKSLKLEALCLVRIMLSCKKHDASDIKNALLPILLSDICKCVQEDWYKVISEALRVLMEIPGLLALGSATKAEKDEVATSLYDAIEPRLSEHDLDQEIKECALSASASLISVLHASLTSDQKNRILTLLLERLKNDTRRIAAIKTLSKVGRAAKSSGDLDLSSVMNEALEQLALLLRQQSRSLKQSALECIDILVLCLPESDVDMDEDLFDSVLKDLGEIISDTDLHICHLSLSASNSILKARPSTGALVKSHVLPASLKLSKSALLQDPALTSLLDLQEQMIASGAIEFDELHKLLEGQMAADGSKRSKQVISNLAQCIATIAAASPSAKQQKFIKSTISAIKPSAANVEATQLNLLVSGNFGRKVDLSKMKGVAESMQKIYFQSFDSSNEDIKHAAALALGRASVGAIDPFLPALLSALEGSSGKKQYLLFSSLREFIHCYRETEGSDLSSSVPLLLPPLEMNCGNDEEGVRAMVAECLGALACLEPKAILPVLQKLATDESDKRVHVRWTVGNAVKFAIGGHISPTELAPFMPTFIELLKEDDLAVKNVALLMVYSAVHHAPQLVVGIMKEQVLPQLYELAQLNMERKIDLGPFKHTVDDALPLRKAALSVFSTCLDKCPSSLDIPAFMPVLAKALADVEDIQLQSHQIVHTMCARHPIPLIAAADSFVGPLEKTVNKKKGQKTGTELERVYEWIKSGLRVMLAMSKLDGIAGARNFMDFVDRIKKSKPHAPFLAQVEDE